ncbi:MAG: Uncharacterized protein XE05_1912, partial [Thermotogales bacterium 46_20]
KNRKRGFSLVELLIVLAVIAALIATITPVALNAIKKAKATQVAQNLKTLATALENAAYVNGVNGNKVLKPGETDDPIELEDLGRDIDSNKYGVWYTSTGTNGEFKAVVYYNGNDVDPSLVNQTLPNATDTKPSGYAITGDNQLGSTTLPDDEKGVFYTFTFVVY